MPSKGMCSGITVQIKNTTLPLCSPISSNLTMLNLMLSKKQSMLFYLTICKFSCEIRKSSQSDTRCYMTTLPWLKNCATLHDTFFAGLLIHSIENGGTIVQCWFIHICEFIRQIIVSRINNHIHISQDIVSILPLLYDPVYTHVLYIFPQEALSDDFKVKLKV